MLAMGQGEGGLQVAQRQGAADGAVDVSPAGLDHGPALAHVEPHQLLDRVEAVPRLQHVLDLQEGEDQPLRGQTRWTSAL